MNPYVLLAFETVYTHLQVNLYPFQGSIHPEEALENQEGL